MIGRADIEGSKSNVAINVWLPQASYPCGNFSDTSSFKLQRSKRSIDHRFLGSYSYWKSQSNEYPRGLVYRVPVIQNRHHEHVLPDPHGDSPHRTEGGSGRPGAVPGVNIALGQGRGRWCTHPECHSDTCCYRAIRRSARSRPDGPPMTSKASSWRPSISCSFYISSCL